MFKIDKTAKAPVYIGRVEGLITHNMHAKLPYICGPACGLAIAAEK